jgi:hypothetical protein
MPVNVVYGVPTRSVTKIHLFSAWQDVEYVEQYSPIKRLKILATTHRGIYEKQVTRAVADHLACPSREGSESNWWR